MRFANVAVLNAADATQASQTSAAVDVSNVFAFSCYGVAVGGTITGTLKIQVSNDPVEAPTAPTNWIDLPSATVSVTAAGSYLIPQTDACYQWMRVVYTKATSAAGAKITGYLTIHGF